MIKHDISDWRVLVVDDEPDNVAVIAETLTFFGATTQTASSGKDAINAIKRFQPTFVLLDIAMPVQDGWETLTEIRSYSEMEDIPVIAVSARAMSKDRVKAFEEGFLGYIVKPVNVPTLVDELATILQQLTS